MVTVQSYVWAAVPVSLGELDMAPQYSLTSWQHGVTTHTSHRMIASGLRCLTQCTLHTAQNPA